MLGKAKGEGGCKGAWSLRKSFEEDDWDGFFRVLFLLVFPFSLCRFARGRWCVVGEVFSFIAVCLFGWLDFVRLIVVCDEEYLRCIDRY